VLVSERGIQREQNFRYPKVSNYLLDRMVPHSKLRYNFPDCYLSVLSDELVDFLLVVLSCSSSRSAMFLKCFIHLLTVLSPMQASPYTSRSRSLDDYCRVSIFHNKFNDTTLTKRHVGDSHFLAVYDRNIRGAHALILHACWRRKVPPVVVHRSLRCSRPILRNPAVLITFSTS
jgi:hypothetical protein